MAEHVWTVLCRKPVFDQKQNPQISLIDVIGRLDLGSRQPLEEAEKGDRPVYNQAEFSMVSLWLRSDVEEPETATLRYEVECPDGQTLKLSESPIDLETNPTHRVILNMPVFPIHGLGFYYWITKVRQPRGKNWHEVARVPVELRVDAVESESRQDPDS